MNREAAAERSSVINSSSTTTLNKPYNHFKQHHHGRPFYLYSPKLSVYLLVTCASLFILFQIQSLRTPSSPSSSSSSLQSGTASRWAFMQKWQNFITNTTINNPRTDHDHHHHDSSCTQKLSDSVTFLPLKDLRYSGATAQQGHTWFMSSMYDTHEEGEVQYQQFPSETSSKGRILCLKGKDTHDGSWNSYALAWPHSLPPNATFMKGLTFVSYNHYNYDNIWHGLSAMVPFVAWHLKNRCESPARWVLYHWGELRTKMGPWLRILMEATFGLPLQIEGFDHVMEAYDGENISPVCFENAVVMRHNEGGMSRQRRIEVYDLLRCRARLYCNVSGGESYGRRRLLLLDGKNTVPVIGMTLFMRSGPRSFKNESAVIDIFGKECSKIKGCRLTVAYSNNLTFCQQVKVMSETDILISPHGAQLTNLFLMDRNSSVMEFFPKGWLKLAGVGQYVYHWMASWSGMIHQGAWRDPDGDQCPYSDDDRRCMSIYKSGRIGVNHTHFSQWSRNVLNEVVQLKRKNMATAPPSPSSAACACN